MVKRITIICIGALLLGACAKSDFTIGRNNADADLKTCQQLTAKKRFESAIECYEIFKSRYRNTAAGQEAELHIGDSFFARKEYLLATESYDAFIRNYPLHERVDYALYRKGLAFLKESPKQIDRDQAYLGDAISTLRMQLRLFPQSSYRNETTNTLTEARRRVAERHYYIGNFYFRTGEYIAAIPRLEQIIADYPELGERQKAYSQLVMAYARMGALENAKLVYTSMQDEFAEGRFTKKAASELRKHAQRNNAQ